jgi:hypothetical protein
MEESGNSVDIPHPLRAGVELVWTAREHPTTELAPNSLKTKKYLRKRV